MADVGLLFMALTFLSTIKLLWQGCKGGLAFVAGWTPVVFSSFVFCFGALVMYGAEWDKSYSTVTTCSYLLHLLYIYLILNIFIDYSEKLKLSASYICLVLLFLVEAFALFIYACDVINNREGDPSSRWWIRTTPYAIIGVIFVIILYLMKICNIEESDYSLILSVAASVLAVNYLVQIINERIVPKDGPYEANHEAGANRPIPKVPRKVQVQEPNTSPSAGRGEGAC
ncbi:hypothetical protein H3S93_07490 [Bifidobacterium sp. W8109]|nr:hypothetical protein [Bifidobacterium asteroides]